MYNIGDFKFVGDSESVFNKLMEHLKEKKLLITDIQGNPLSESEILNILNLNDQYSFYTKHIYEIEKEFIEDFNLYVSKVEEKFKEISDIEDKSLIITAFVEVLEALIELQKVSKYFNFSVIDIESINALAEKALERIEEDDIDYIIDVLEYELIPKLNNTKSKLLERQCH